MIKSFGSEHGKNNKAPSPHAAKPSMLENDPVFQCLWGELTCVMNSK